MSLIEKEKPALNERTFVIKNSDIVGRIDPLYYYSVNKLLLVKSTKYEVKKLSEVINMQRGRFGHRPRNDPRFYDGEYPFIQTGDIVRANKSGDRIEFSQTLNELGLKTSRLFSQPVVVLTIAANIGDTALLNFPACFPDSLIAMTPKDDRLELEYINVYFKFIKSYLEDLAPQSAQKNINYQQLAPVPIVIPPKTVQTDVVNIYESAVSLKREKENKANKILEGIDNYLLAELGITLPKQDKIIDKRMFTVGVQEVIGKRLDPKLYDPFTKSLKQSVIYSFFQKMPLRKLVSHSVAGDWGNDIDEQNSFGYEKCLVIRSTEFDNRFNLNFYGSRVKYRLIRNEKLQRIDIKVNDLLIEKSGGSPDQPVGRVALITKEYIDSEKLCYSNFIHKIRVDSTIVNPNYLFHFLRSMHNIKLTDSMQSQTNGIRNLIMTEFFNQAIVLPPLAKQEEISKKINLIHSQARKLQSEAIQVLSEAKLKVENLIIGK
jgi:type I restriction enzyme S subunit